MIDNTYNEEARAYIAIRIGANKGLELNVLAALLKTHSVARIQRFVTQVQDELGIPTQGKAGGVARWKRAE